MNWVQINIRVNEDFRYMKIHIFALYIYISQSIYHLLSKWSLITPPFVDNETRTVKGVWCSQLSFSCSKSSSALPVTAGKERKKQPKPIVMGKSKWKPARWRTQCVRQFRMSMVHSFVSALTRRIIVCWRTTVKIMETAKRRSVLSQAVWLSWAIFLCVRYWPVINLRC